MASAGRGLAQGVERPEAGMDDATLTRKVESQFFRDEDSPKAKVNVNVVGAGPRRSAANRRVVSRS